MGRGDGFMVRMSDGNNLGHTWQWEKRGAMEGWRDGAVGRGGDGVASSPRPSPPFRMEERVPEGRERRAMGQAKTAAPPSLRRVMASGAAACRALRTPTTMGSYRGLRLVLQKRK